jgi:hypothetical protein
MHWPNHYKLIVYRDGHVDWFECNNTTDGLIDNDASGFAALPEIICVGTGSNPCNCEYCSEWNNATVGDKAEFGFTTESGFTCIDDAITMAVDNAEEHGNWNWDQGDMLNTFDEMFSEPGYFEDEE